VMQYPVASLDFLFFPLPFCLPLSPGVGLGLGDGFLGEGLMKLGGRITLRELFMTISKISLKDTRWSSGC
jgi:hypothetical protein